MNNILKKKLNIQQQIGRGGFGDVYKAHNLKQGRIEAVKVSNRDIADPRGAIKLVKYEAGILNYLSGVKGIPQFYKYSEEDGVQTMSM